MSDYIIRGAAADNQIRFFAASTRELTEKAREIHQTSPVVTAALGRLLTAGAMMGSMCKNDTDLLTIQIKGDGPIKGLTVTADARGNVKGYPYENVVLIPASAAGKLDVGAAIGKGVLSVIKDIGLKEPYVGQTDLVSGEIAEDLTYYFATSDQVPTSVALGVRMNHDNTVRQAGGFIIQLMPYTSEEVIVALENALAKFTSMTEELEQRGTIEAVMEHLFEDMGYQIFDKMDTQFSCNCSRERVEKAVISIGEKEIKEMIEDSKPIEVNCHFCNKKYTFTVEDLKQMI